MKKIVIIASLVTVVVHAKQMQRSSAQQRVPATPAKPVSVPVETPQAWVQPDITKLPPPLNTVKMKPEEYLQNKVAAESQQLINDIFPKEDTIERVVFEFKDQFPGPNKTADTAMLYNAIINNPEIRKVITLKNAVPVYNFIREAINRAWDKKDNLVWAS